jgi:hypothetical protein
MEPKNPDLQQPTNKPAPSPNSPAANGKKPIWTDEVDEVFVFSDLPNDPEVTAPSRTK